MYEKTNSPLPSRPVLHRTAKTKSEVKSRVIVADERSKEYLPERYIENLLLYFTLTQTLSLDGPSLEDTEKDAADRFEYEYLEKNKWKRPFKESRKQFVVSTEDKCGSQGLLDSDVVCNGECKAGEECVTRMESLRTQVRVIKTRGRKGTILRTRQNIPAFAPVIEYRGEVFPKEKAEELERRDRKRGMATIYTFALTARYVIYPVIRGNVSKYMSHSCDPNCKARVIWVGGIPTMIFFALRDINNGEELTFSYGETYPAIPCFCGSANCKGTIGNGPVAGVVRGKKTKIKARTAPTRETKNRKRKAPTMTTEPSRKMQKRLTLTPSLHSPVSPPSTIVEKLDTDLPSMSKSSNSALNISNKKKELTSRKRGVAERVAPAIGKRARLTKDGEELPSMSSQFRAMEQTVHRVQCSPPLTPSPTSTSSSFEFLSPISPANVQKDDSSSDSILAVPSEVTTETNKDEAAGQEETTPYYPDFSFVSHPSDPNLEVIENEDVETENDYVDGQINLMEREESECAFFTSNNSLTTKKIHYLPTSLSPSVHASVMESGVSPSPSILSPGISLNERIADEIGKDAELEEDYVDMGESFSSPSLPSLHEDSENEDEEMDQDEESVLLAIPPVLPPIPVPSPIGQAEINARFVSVVDVKSGHSVRIDPHDRNLEMDEYEIRKELKTIVSKRMQILKHSRPELYESCAKMRRMIYRRQSRKDFNHESEESINTLYKLLLEFTQAAVNLSHSSSLVSKEDLNIIKEKFKEEASKNSQMYRDRRMN